jgi:hypothetical protein
MSYLNQFKLPDGINDPNAAPGITTPQSAGQYSQAELDAAKANAAAQANLDARMAQGYGATSPMQTAGSDMFLAGQGMQASGLVGVLGGAYDIYQGIQNMNTARDSVAKYQGKLDDLQANQPSLATPSQYYEMAKNAYDSRLMQMRVDDINRGLANTTAAASQFGSRGLGALAGATQSANRAQQEEVLRQQQMQTAAMGQLADARMQSQQMQLQQNQFNQNMSFEQLSMANQQLAGAQEQIGAGVGAAVGGLGNLSMAGQVMDMGTDMLGMKNAESVTGPDIPKDEMTLRQLRKSGAQKLPLSQRGAIFGRGAYFNEDGGKIQKTPGKFSHEENEMAVITEEGKDTGIRVTGGEYVLNPDQSKTIKKLVEAGDKDALMKFMDDLLDEPQFA